MLESVKDNLALWSCRVGAFLLLAVLVVACASPKTVPLSRWNYGAIEKKTALTDEEQRLYSDLYSAAINERLMERYDAAYVLLQQAISVNPDGAEALYELAMIAMHYGEESGSVRKGQGELWLKKAASLSPDNAEYQRAYAMAMADNGDFAGAIAVYERLVAQKESEELLSDLLNLYRAAERDDEALALLDRLEVLEGATNNIYFERYRIYIAQKDTTKAFAAIDALCEANAGDLYFPAFKANLYHEQGYNDKALALYQEVLAKEPKQVYARVSLLNFYKTLREDDLYQQLFFDMLYDTELESEVRDNLMRQFYVDALQNKKDTAEVMPIVRKVMALPQENRNLGEMTLGYLSEVGVPRNEMSFVHEQVLKVEPDFDLSRLELIFAHVEKGDSMTVHQLCETGRRYNSNQIAYYLYDALALNEMERPQEAIAVLQLGAEKVDTTVAANVRSQLFSLLGDFLHEEGRTQEAYEAYDKAVTLDESNLLCMNNYAYFLSIENGDLDKAAALSKKTIEAEPQNATYLDTYAWILYQQENYTQAKIYIDEMLKHTSATVENVTLYDHAGDIYFHCGEAELAMGFWKKALNLAEEKEMRESLQRKIRRGKP